MSKLKIVNMNINDLKPYRQNPRKNEPAVEIVMKSIKEFGFLVPMVIDKDNVIVTGHTRFKAAKRLGLSEVPCVIASDLTEEQVQAFRLVDNKTSEYAEWDKELLQFELITLNLDFDIGAFDFDVPIFDASDTDKTGDGEDLPEDEEEKLPYGAARERTAENYLLREYSDFRSAGWYQMPVLDPVRHIPERLIGFNYMLSSEEFDAGIHFYIDDYQFERVWNNPYKYLEKLAKFDCVLTPDFSLYMDMPRAMKVWNIYRSRMIGQIMQDSGIVVIPTLSWAEEETFSFCFDGIEPGGTVSVSTVGVKQNKEAMQIWTAGMDEAMKRLEPSAVVVYGGDIGYDFRDTEAVYIENEVLERWKSRGSQRHDQG